MRSLHRATGFALAIGWLTATLCGCTREEATSADIQALRTALSKQGGETTDSMPVQAFYRQLDGRPAWSADGKPNRRARDLVELIMHADEDGLDPNEYDAGRLTQAVQSTRTPQDTTTLELRLTNTLLRYLQHLSQGHRIAARMAPEWQVVERKLDLASLAAQAVRSNQLAALPEKARPPQAGYQQLRKALLHYQELSGGNLWQPPPGDPAAAASSATVARDLHLLGDAGDDSPTPSHEAISHFQERHGLSADGTLNAPTLTALSVPPADRVRQIALNLERWRWMPEQLGKTHIWVDIPRALLQVRDGDQIPLHMRVVVGKADRRTPVLHADMSYLVFHPYWNIPDGITAREELPRILADPGYLQRKDIEVVRVEGDQRTVVDPATIDWSAGPPSFDFQLRQRPGDSNALGRVKFMFPNSAHVYLHDTPQDNLFDRLTRTFSHGCVRVEQADELARWLLRDQSEWTPAAIEAAMSGAEEKHVELKQPVPVHLTYFTASADADGTVQFSPDIYDLDTRQAALDVNPDAYPAAPPTQPAAP